MITKSTPSIIHHFSSIEDPRVNRQKRHQLQDIFFISICCAIICGADNWVADLAPTVASVSYDGEYGRIETRSIRIRATADIAWLQERHDWKGLQSIIAVTSKREIGDKVTEETRYFISSLDANDPAIGAGVARAHIGRLPWGNINNLSGRFA